MFVCVYVYACVRMYMCACICADTYVCMRRVLPVCIRDVVVATGSLGHGIRDVAAHMPIRK